MTLSFPPDTDTPGYAQENVGKPEETKLIAEATGLYQPEYVAKCIIDDAVVRQLIPDIKCMAHLWCKSRINDKA